MFTKKVKITWQRDSYFDCNTADRDTSQSTALAELDEKTAEMISAGKMKSDAYISGTGPTIVSTRYVTDQAAADEWVNFITEFATKHGLINPDTVILSI